MKKEKPPYLHQTAVFLEGAFLLFIYNFKLSIYLNSSQNTFYLLIPEEMPLERGINEQKKNS